MKKKNKNWRIEFLIKSNKKQESKMKSRNIENDKEYSVEEKMKKDFKQKTVILT